jgi:RNA polymerase sigma-70 factor (ECF subfamily)|tara:strand:+ start:132 stop:650 length:519 start_codon:yes stop_codon:yes gene_type:complete
VQLFNEISGLNNLNYNTKHKIFMQAIDTYGSRLYNISLFVLKNEVLAEDSTQESFQKIWKGLDKFSFNSSLYTWMYRITYNNALTTFNKEKKHRKSDVEHDFSSTDVDIANNITLKDAIQKLPFNYRKAIIMFYFLEHSIKEISIELLINENTIKSWLKRGKEQLKDYIDEK